MQERHISIVLQGKTLAEQRIGNAEYVYYTTLWGCPAEIYYSPHAWSRAKERWGSPSKEYFMQECMDILDNDDLDMELLSVPEDTPIALLDEATGKIIWFRIIFNASGMKYEIFIHSVLLFEYSLQKYVFVTKNDFYVKICKNGEIVSGINRIPEFKVK